MTYDGNFATTKTSRLNIPSPKTIATATYPGSGAFSVPLNLYTDNDNIYLIQPTNNYVWFASKSEPTDLFQQTNFQIHSQSNLLTKVHPNTIGTTNSYWSFGTMDDLGVQNPFIFRTVPNNPKFWYYTGSSLPTSAKAAGLYVDATNIYLFGGYATGVSNQILTSTVATPTTWATSGNVLPAARAEAALVTVGSTLYLYGGTQDGSAAVNTIYSASTATPTVWSNTGATLPANIKQAISYVNATNIYLYVGTGTDTTIYRAAIGTPTAFTNVGTITGTDITGGALYADANFIYIYGSFLLRAPISDPLTWTKFTANALATAAAASHVAIHNKRIWLFGGRGSAGTAITTIQSTDTNGHVNFVNSGSVLPAALMGGTLFKTSQNLYILGGSGNTGNIYQAALSNPNTWTLHSANGPQRSFGTGFIVGNYLYYYGGETAEGTVFPTATGMRFTISNGVLEVNSGVSGSLGGFFKLPAPVNVSRQVMFVVGNYVYMLGGYIAGPALNTSIYRAYVSDLNTTAAWANIGTLSSGFVDASVAIINDTLYILGGGNSATPPYNTSTRNVVSANLNDLARGLESNALFDIETNFIDTAFAGAGCVCRNDRLWLIGGRTAADGTTVIKKSTGFEEYRPIFPNAVGTAESIPVISPTSGLTGSYNQFQLTGMLPWLVTDK